MNLIIVSGKLGNDPQIINTQGDRKMFAFSIYNRYKRGKTWEVMRFSVVCFENLEKIVSKLKKGTNVLITGKIESTKNEKYQFGTKYISIVANTIEFVDKKQEQDEEVAENRDPFKSPPHF